MSILSTVYIPDGIIMAADSRLTGRNFLPSERGGTQNMLQLYTLSDCSQKIVLMHKAPIGISSYGDATLNGQTVSDYLRLFEIQTMEQGDSVSQTAEKLYNELTNEVFDTSFVVAGYDNDIPFVYDVSKTGMQCVNVGQNGNMTYGAHWNGQIAAIGRLFNSQPATIFPWNLMQLKDGIDLAEFIIDATIKYERFADGIQTCGGPIDILVITKDNAFWYQHKVFAPK